MRYFCLTTALFCALTLPVAHAQTGIVGKPAWAAEAVFYQIFPERFRNGDPKNDPTRDSLETPPAAGTDWKISPWTADWYGRDDWEKALGSDFYRHGVFERRYGGDLQGVIDKLGYLSDLGINAIYFNPLFYARSMHKYDGNSYHHIDPYFGPDPKGDLATIATETSDPRTWKWTTADKLFLDLIRQAHAKGMRVVIDGVFNHTGRDFFAFKDLNVNQARSAYKDWYVVNSFDDPKTKRNEFSYKGWWGHASLPVFAATKDNKDMYAAPKAYIFDATRRWMQPNGKTEDGIDGWRLDVADERPAKFWADWNGLVRQLNPNAYTTAEIWSNAAELVSKGGFSACMNYNAFTIPVKGFLVDNNVAPSKFAKLLEDRRHQFPPATAAVMQNLMDSHDTDRLASMIVNGEGTIYPNSDQIEFNSNNDARASKTYKIRKPNERERQIQRTHEQNVHAVLGSDLVDRGFGEGGVDFLADRTPRHSIVTNPPFVLAERFIHHALEVAERVAVIVPLAFSAGQRRCRSLFLPHPPALELVLARRPSMPPGGMDIPAKGGTTDYAWLIWDRGHRGPTVKRWWAPSPPSGRGAP
jgi:glycosidase